jgi:hypothetical protein
MIDTQILKFACAFCNYNSDYKKSVKTHFPHCPEKYNSRIDLANRNLFRMVYVKYQLDDRKNIKIEKNKREQLKKEKIEPQGRKYPL